MPRKIDSRDFLYRKVNPGGWDASGVLADAFQDNYENLSFSLASIALPCEILEKFAGYKSVKKICKTDKEPNCLEMYHAGYRVAMISVELVRGSKFIFAIDEAGNEYNDEGHINVINGKDGAIIWSMNAKLLNAIELQRNAIPLLKF